MHDDDFQPPSSSWALRLTILAIVVAFSLVGTGFARDAVQAILLSRAAANFASVQGKITRSSLRTQGNNQVPDVRFEYTVDGRTYEADNHLFAISYRDGRLASRATARYKVNAPITVYYDPKEPARATLAREHDLRGPLVRGAFGLLFYGIAIFAVVTFFRSRKKARALAYAKHLAKKREAALEAERAARSAPR